MSVLGYSELMKKIFGITPKTLQGELSQLLKTKPTQKKIEVLRELASTKRATIGKLMKKKKMTYTGGSFNSMKTFFEELYQLKILQKEIIGRRTYYTFTKKSDLSKWLVV